MRKSFYAIAALLAITASCSKESTDSSFFVKKVNPDAPVFTSELTSKAVLEPVSATSARIIWENGDVITVWNGSQTASYTASVSGTTVTFTTSDAFSAADNYVALYPADADAAFTSGIATTLPAAQTATAGSFDPAANVAVATSSTTSLAFRNLVAYVQFTVPSGMTDLTSVSFKGNGAEKVAGAVSVDTSTPALTATGSETATLTGSFTEGETYCLAVAPQPLAQGYTLTITRSSGTYEMNSLKDVTFVRSGSRNVGPLWNGQVVMEGTAVGTPTAISMLPFPGNVNHCDEVYDYRGALSAGTLTVRGMGIVASDVVIPADGNYHVMYNKTRGKVRIYSQDIFTHLGKSTPMNNGSGTNYYPVDFTLNDFTGVAHGASFSLKDYYGSDTGASITVNASAANGSFNNTNENVFGNSGNRATNSPYVDGDFFPSYGWGRPCSFANSDKTVDSGDVFFHLTGLDDTASYDVKIVGIRYNSSANLRVAKYTIGNDERIIDNGLAAAGKLDLNAFKDRHVEFAGISPSGGTISIKMNAISRYRQSNNDYFCEAFISFIYLSKIVYSKN